MNPIQSYVYTWLSHTWWENDNSYGFTEQEPINLVIYNGFTLVVGVEVYLSVPKVSKIVAERDKLKSHTTNTRYTVKKVYFNSSSYRRKTYYNIVYM